MLNMLRYQKQYSDEVLKITKNSLTLTTEFLIKFFTQLMFIDG